jgi:hypothetical protein
VPQAGTFPDFSVLEYADGRAALHGHTDMPGDEDYRVAFDALKTLELEDLTHVPSRNSAVASGRW